MDNGWQVSRPRRIKKGRKYVRYALQYRKPDRNEETLGMWTSCAKEILFRSLVGVAHQRYPASVCLQLPIRLPSLPVSKALSKAEPLEKMFKRKAVLTQVLYEEKAVYEAINKLASACNKGELLYVHYSTYSRLMHYSQTASYCVFPYSVRFLYISTIRYSHTGTI